MLPAERGEVLEQIVVNGSRRRSKRTLRALWFLSFRTNTPAHLKAHMKLSHVATALVLVLTCEVALADEAVQYRSVCLYRQLNENMDIVATEPISDTDCAMVLSKVWSNAKASAKVRANYPPTEYGFAILLDEGMSNRVVYSSIALKHLRTGKISDVFASACETSGSPWNQRARALNSAVALADAIALMNESCDLNIRCNLSAGKPVLGKRQITDHSRE